MKNYIIHLLIGLMTATALSSCDDFLESKPRNFLDPDDFYINSANVESGLMGIYQPLTGLNGGQLYAQTNLLTQLVVSDLEYCNSTSSDYYIQTFNFQSTSPYVSSYWGGCYVGISRANSFIDRVEEIRIRGLDDKDRDAAVGEAYFLRAFYYWHLAANWGGVPLLTTFENDINPHRKRASLKEVYEQIVKDLKKAEGMVYEAGAFTHAGRVTRSTVQALLARVCLYMAGNPLNDKSQYSEAAEWARKVKESGLHELNPSYENLFTRLMYKEYDLDYREMMWEAEFKGATGETIQTRGRVGKVNGLTCHDNNLGYAAPQILVSRVMDDYYLEDPLDTRYAWNVPPFDYGTGSTANIRSRAIELRSIGKFRLTVSPIPSTTGYSEINFPLMRYADVLLMLAEAVNETEGPVDEVMDALNRVRRRAGAREVGNRDPDDGTPVIILSDRDECREFIKKERARELCFEATRRLDLIRWGQLVENVQYMSSIATQILARRAGNNISEKHNLLPIPMTELNSNSLMVQNPGW